MVNRLVSFINRRSDPEPSLLPPGNCNLRYKIQFVTILMHDFRICIQTDLISDATIFLKFRSMEV